MAGPFKMKGSPMQKNFGIGSPMKQKEEVVSKTSPGPGWTKTKGTNIWTSPKEKSVGQTKTLEDGTIFPEKTYKDETNRVLGKKRMMMKEMKNLKSMTKVKRNLKRIR